MTCAELEILLCDYVDGTLHAEERTALESSSGRMRRLARNWLTTFAGVTAFIERVPEAEPPAELMTRILHHAPHGTRRSCRALPATVAFLGQAAVRRMLQSVLQPRYVMGMAMTILSFSMLARFAHIEPRQLRPSDLDPVKVWQGIDDHSHRVYDRAMKYYDNLRLVIEIQSRLTRMDRSGSGSHDGGAQPAARTKRKR